MGDQLALLEEPGTGPRGWQPVTPEGPARLNRDQAGIPKHAPRRGAERLLVELVCRGLDERFLPAAAALVALLDEVATERRLGEEAA